MRELRTSRRSGSCRGLKLLNQVQGLILELISQIVLGLLGSQFVLNFIELVTNLLISNLPHKLPILTVLLLDGGLEISVLGSKLSGETLILEPALIALIQNVLIGLTQALRNLLGILHTLNSALLNGGINKVTSLINFLRELATKAAKLLTNSGEALHHIDVLLVLSLQIGDGLLALAIGNGSTAIGNLHLNAILTLKVGQSILVDATGHASCSTGNALLKLILTLKIHKVALLNLVAEVLDAVLESNISTNLTCIATVAPAPAAEATVAEEATDECASAGSPSIPAPAVVVVPASFNNGRHRIHNETSYIFYRTIHAWTEP